MCRETDTMLSLVVAIVPPTRLRPKMNHDADDVSLIPLRMLNEFAYCPRLFHLMHVEGRWADNAMLSFGYAMLAKECAVALMSEGLDPCGGCITSRATADRRSRWT